MPLDIGKATGIGNPFISSSGKPTLGMMPMPPSGGILKLADTIMNPGTIDGPEIYDQAGRYLRNLVLNHIGGRVISYLQGNKQ